MAAVTPVTAGTAGYVDRSRGLYVGVRASSEAILTVGTLSNDRSRFETIVVYFASIADGDTWASGIPGIKAAFWSGDANDADLANATLTDAATGTITFQTGTTVNGFLLLFVESGQSAALGGRGR